MSEKYTVAIVGSGPGGLSAAARAAQHKMSHILLEASSEFSYTIFRYQKGKFVMATPDVLPLRSDLAFEAGTREVILDAWNQGVESLGVNARKNAEVTKITGQKGDFTLTLANGDTLQAEYVVFGIGLQGNIRKLGVPGEDLPFVQYQLDDPEEYEDETIVVVGAGDAAIENAVALAKQNDVIIVNRRDEFSRAKEGNLSAITAAIEDKNVRLDCLYNTGPVRVELRSRSENQGKPGVFVLNTPDGELQLPCNRIIARLGALPPRQFVESCGIQFPSKDPAAVPAVSPQYESNVAGLYIIGALAGYPLIKQAMNQGYEVIEFILGNQVEPADEDLLRQKFKQLPGFTTVDAALAQIIGNVPLLSGLTPLQLREFMIDSDILAPKPKDVVFKLNDYTNTFFSILKGTVDIQIDPNDPKKVVTLKQGQFFGEMSLIGGRRRSATVLAGKDCVLIETPRRSMNKLINSVASVKRVIDEAFLLRAIQQYVAPGASAEELADVVHSARIESYKGGQTIFKEGDVGDSLHLIRVGSVTVSKNIGGHEVVLSYVQAGNYIGEMALLSGATRSATVRATVRTETVRLDGTAFKALLNRSPELRRKVEDTFEARVEASERMENAPEAGDIISFMMQQGLGEATDVLLIDESLCVRCDHCERACAATHQGISRLNREAGPTFANVHVPTSCRHCEHPHCMKDCPPDAIHRAANGEVFIDDSCIGCGNCERNCPYGVIQMAAIVPYKPKLWSWLLFGMGNAPGAGKAKKSDDGVKKAVKCDMCKGMDGGPACVRACPTGAAIRVGPDEFLAISKREAGLAESA